MNPRAPVLLALALTLPACTPAPSPTPAPDATAEEDEPVAVIDLEPYLPGTGLLAARVTVGDSSLPFLFDTGGGGTLFTPAVAVEAGCEPFGRVTGFRHDGQMIHARRCPASPLTIGGWTAPARENGVFDLMSLLPEGVPPLGGLLSLSTFEGLPITLDLGARRVIVESEASLQARVAGLPDVPVRQGRQSGGAMLDLFLPLDAPGGPLWLELDSGNTGPVLLAPHAAAQLGLDLSPDESRTVTLHLQGYGPVQVEARQKEMIYDGLLNAAFLRHLRLTLDLARTRAWATPVADG